MSKKFFYPNILFLCCAFSPFVLGSCAFASRGPAAQKAKSDVAADTALGALPPKGNAENLEKAQDLQSEEESFQDIQEMRKKEKEEEQRRLHRMVTEDRIVDQQVRTPNQ